MMNFNYETFLVYLLGGVGIAAMVKKIENDEYMGFDDLCKYNS